MTAPVSSILKFVLKFVVTLTVNPFNVFGNEQAYIFYGSEDDVVAPEVINLLIYTPFPFTSYYEKLFVFKDVEWLLTKLGNLKYAHKIEGYSHMDFIWVHSFHFKHIKGNS